MGQCVFCRGELASGSSLCPKCGRAQPEQPINAEVYVAKTPRRQDKRCPGCGEGLPAHARFCFNCGRSLSLPVEQGQMGAAPGPLAGGQGNGGPAIVPGAAGVSGGNAPVPAMPPGSMARSPQPGSLFWLSRAILMGVLVVIVIGAASAGLYLSTRRSSSTSSHLPGSTLVSPTATPVPYPTLQFNGPAATDMKGLHIQTDGISCGGYLVLTRPQDTYGDATLAPMRAYVSALLRDTEGAYVNPLPSDLPSLPDTLQWVPGTGYSCVGKFAFTDIGSQSIQINGMDVQQALDPVSNTFAYNLVDTCSLQAGCPSGLGSGGTPCGYFVEFHFQGGPRGTQAKSSLISSATDQCPLPLTLQPAQTTEVEFSVDSVPAHLIYKAHLAVEITQGGGSTATLMLPSAFDSTFAFIEDNSPNIVCYGLTTGNTFTLLSPDEQKKAFCI